MDSAEPTIKVTRILREMFGGNEKILFLHKVLPTHRSGQQQRLPSGITQILRTLFSFPPSFHGIIRNSSAGKTRPSVPCIYLLISLHQGGPRLEPSTARLLQPWELSGLWAQAPSGLGFVFVFCFSWLSFRPVFVFKHF